MTWQQGQLELSDNDILEYIKTVAGEQLRSAHKGLTHDKIVSIGYTTEMLVDCIKRLKWFPPREQVEIFKADANEESLRALQDPFVSLGLFLKFQDEHGNLPFFEHVLRMAEGATSLELLGDEKNPGTRDDPVMDRFLKEALFFCPPLPEISLKELCDESDDGVGFRNLCSVGRVHLDRIITDMLFQRFKTDEIQSLRCYTSCNKIFAHWSRLYEFSDLRFAPEEIFFAYAGALSISDHDILHQWVTILIEPLLSQFEKPVDINIAIKESVLQELPTFDIRLVYTSSNKELPIYILQAVLGSDHTVLATTSSPSLFEGELKLYSIVSNNSITMALARRAVSNRRDTSASSEAPIRRSVRGFF